MRPVCEVLINGRAASGTLMQRLSSCTVTDEEGIASDRVDIDLADFPPAEIPKPGATIAIRMGYGTALSDMGEFIAEEVEVSVKPGTMRITGKSADLGGDVKDQKERHWDDVTLGKLVRQIAGEHGLRASVDPALASFHYSWIGQVQESDLAFLERLAHRHAALFAIKRGTLIFAIRGSGKSPTGKDLSTLKITTDILVEGSAKVTWSSRPKYGEVIAHYMDRATGKREEVSIVLQPDGPDEDDEPDGEGAFTLDQPFASKAEAEAAAKAKVAELKRASVTFEAAVVGNPIARGGAPVTFKGVRPGLDGLIFIVETAVHRFTAANGYTTQLTGALKA